MPLCVLGPRLLCGDWWFAPKTGYTSLLSNHHHNHHMHTLVHSRAEPAGSHQPCQALARLTHVICNPITKPSADSHVQAQHNRNCHQSSHKHVTAQQAQQGDLLIQSHSIACYMYPPLNHKQIPPCGGMCYATIQHAWYVYT